MSWFLAFVGFAVLIVLHEAGHFAAAKAVGMRVERFSLFFGPMVLKLRRGETEYGIGVIPLGGYVKISGMSPHEELPPEVAHRAYFRQKPWKRIVVILAGPFTNIVIAFAIMFVLFLSHAYTTATNEVADIAKGAAAQGALQPGDRLLAVDGVRGDNVRLREQIGTHTCPGGSTKDGCEAAVPAKVTLVRDGRERSVEIKPKYSAANERPLLGFTFGTAWEGTDAADSASLAVTRMWSVSKATVSVFGRLFTSSEARKQVSGIVGTYETTRQSIEFDAAQAFLIIALISLSLAIINLAPFLPLDGGHVFWALAEKVRGRPIPYSVLERASVVGFLLVIALFFIGLTNDIDRLRNEGFGIR